MSSNLMRGTVTRHVRYRRKLKQDILNKYGLMCACCGLTDFEFLTIHHMNNDGGSENRYMQTTAGMSQGQAQSKLYRNLRRDPPRADIAILCWNCNSSLGVYGYCPHKPIYKLADS